MAIHGRRGDVGERQAIARRVVPSHLSLLGQRRESTVSQVSEPNTEQRGFREHSSPLPGRTQNGSPLSFGCILSSLPPASAMSAEIETRSGSRAKKSEFLTKRSTADIGCTNCAQFLKFISTIPWPPLPNEAHTTLFESLRGLSGGSRLALENGEVIGNGH